MTKKDRIRYQKFNSLIPATLNKFYGILRKYTIYEQYDRSIYKNAMYTHLIVNNSYRGFLVYYKVPRFTAIESSRIKTVCESFLNIGVPFSSDPEMKFTCEKCKYIILKDILKE